jgi:hypothetical protein
MKLAQYGLTVHVTKGMSEEELDQKIAALEDAGVDGYLDAVADRIRQHVPDVSVKIDQV